MTLRARIRQSGFTLVELMISLALGLLIVLALVTMLINVNRNNNELGYSQRMVENGRFAMQLLENDIQHTGYWGGFVPNYDELTSVAVPALASTAGGQVPTGLPNPCLAYSVANWTAEYKANLIGIAAQGGNVTAAAAVPYCSGVLTSPKASNDVLVVRHLEPCLAGSGTAECANTLASANPDVYFQATQCSTETATPYVMSALTADLSLHKRNCTTLADIRRLASTMYYVKDVSGTPTLMRSQLVASGGPSTHQAAQPLVENIEGFRVEFGIDAKSDSNEDVDFTAAVNWANAANKTSPRNRGDGVPESFIRCTQAVPCTAAQMMNAVAIKVFVLVRAESKTAAYVDAKTYKMGSADSNCTSAANADASAACAPVLGPFNDNYRRHLFTQTFRLVNVAGRRETP